MFRVASESNDGPRAKIGIEVIHRHTLSFVPSANRFIVFPVEGRSSRWTQVSKDPAQLQWVTYGPSMYVSSAHNCLTLPHECWPSTWGEAICVHSCTHRIASCAYEPHKLEYLDTPSHTHYAQASKHVNGFKPLNAVKCSHSNIQLFNLKVVCFRFVSFYLQEKQEKEKTEKKIKNPVMVELTFHCTCKFWPSASTTKHATSHNTERCTAHNQRLKLTGRCTRTALHNWKMKNKCVNMQAEIHNQLYFS